MNANSIKIVGDWSKKMEVSMGQVLAVSMDILGKNGAEACKRAIIFMAQSAKNLTAQSKKRRKVERDPEYHNAEYVNVWHKGKESRFYRWNFLCDDTGNLPKSIVQGTWEQAQNIKNQGLARRSWTWGLKDLGQPGGEHKPIAGIADVTTIITEKSAGYILRNRLSYLLKAMPTGWETIVAQKAMNRIMAQARNKIEWLWKAEMSRARRGGLAVARNLSSFFLKV